MTSKSDVISSNPLSFALEILKLLAEKPHKKAELEIALGDRGFVAVDLDQKIERTIRKLRSCGFQIQGAPNCPYRLVESVFPVLLAEEQRESLVLAAHVLADMGFSTQASQLYRIGNIRSAVQSSTLKVDFHPPVDYSDEAIDQTVRLLQQRIQQKRRFVLWYCSSKGREAAWDLDKCELRLHNGVLYLFAVVPTMRSRRFDYLPNVDQNFMFRIDRILRIGAASQTPWTYSLFPTLTIRYRLFGDLSTYKPRRSQEKEQLRQDEAGFVEIITEEEYLFWFRQRILQYGASAKVIEPQWFADEIQDVLRRAFLNYENREG
ncbi:helix-turn-helix transcriptional regulator [Leptolyngbya ohadii]|uniref:helix-turn-helix transcriptional regulator n=1 Tax=Leptolyngbya ohadii TaxID=1962290 RepID=UPI000B59E816|nr:WYL domain-containing protein [Leptolyngbya ohadii]